MAPFTDHIDEIDTPYIGTEIQYLFISLIVGIHVFFVNQVAHNIENLHLKFTFEPVQYFHTELIGPGICIDPDLKFIAYLIVEVII